MHTQNPPSAKAEMLIHQPIHQVFDAFINPEVTSKFWFSKGSQCLEVGQFVRWDWEMYGFSIDVYVKAIEANKRILIEWPNTGEPTTVEWTFTSRADNSTFVSIINSGFTGNDDEILTQLVNATEGFTLVLAGLKAYLEHGIVLNLIKDRFPDGLLKNAD